MKVEGDGGVVYDTDLVNIPAEDGEMLDVVALEAHARLPEKPVPEQALRIDPIAHRVSVLQGSSEEEQLARRRGIRDTANQCLNFEKCCNGWTGNNSLGYIVNILDGVIAKF